MNKVPKEVWIGLFATMALLLLFIGINFLKGDDQQMIIRTNAGGAIRHCAGVGFGVSRQFAKTLDGRVSVHREVTWIVHNVA